MGVKGSYGGCPKGRVKLKDSSGLSEMESTFCDHYVGAIDKFSGTDADKDMMEAAVWALKEAGYTISATNNQRKEVRRILNKPTVQARINELLKDRDNLLVYDRYWLLKEYKSFYHKAKAETVKKSLLDSMSKIAGIFNEVPANQNKETDPAAIAKSAFDKRRQKERDQKKEENAKVLEFPKEKEGTNGESN